ncbi:MAG: hypothetical protein PWP04_1422 [Candidatus Atribacteria bacterium]|nr:hypothetical protein [Candidatus Atribacteria bacterium]
MKKLVLALVLVLAFALPALANPFVDVPLNHWAYDAVQSLAAKGVVIGYPDGTFGGNRALTRYEFAQAIARTLGYMEQYVDEAGLASQEDIAMLEKLVQEFADELKMLGITVDDLKAALGENTQAIRALEARVDELEKYAEPVLVTGEFDVTYEAYSPADIAAGKDVATWKDETTLNIAATINDYTIAGLELTVDDTFTTPVVSADNFYIEYQKDEWYIKVGDIGLDKVASGLVLGDYQPDDPDDDDDYALDYEGFYAVYTPEDEDFILKMYGGSVNEVFAVRSEWEEIGLMLTWMPEGPYFYGVNSDLIVSVDAWTDFDEEDLKLTVEGAYGVMSGTYGAAGELWIDASDDVDVTLDAHYVTAGFTPANSVITYGGTSDFADDELGFGVGAAIYLSDQEDPEEDQWILDLSYDWAQALSSGAPTTSEVGATFTFIPSDAIEDEKGVLDINYDLLTASAGAFIGYQKYDLDIEEEDEAAYLTAFAQYDQAVNRALVAGALTYEQLADNLTYTLEGRYDNGGVVPYSVYAEVAWAMEENTTLTLGYEWNTFDGGVGDDDYDFEFDGDRGGVIDQAGTITAELNVTF